MVRVAPNEPSSAGALQTTRLSPHRRNWRAGYLRYFTSRCPSTSLRMATATAGNDGPGIPAVPERSRSRCGEILRRRIGPSPRQPGSRASWGCHVGRADHEGPPGQAREGGSSFPCSEVIDAVEVHHLVPGGDEIVDEALFCVIRSVHFRDRPQLGVRTEDEIDAGARPPEFTRPAIAPLEHILGSGDFPAMRCSSRAGSRRSRW